MSREHDDRGHGLSPRRIANLVQGLEPPDDRALDLIAKAFGVGRDYFVEGRPPPPQPEREATTTDLPFSDALRILMTERELTFRALAQEFARRDPERRGLSHSHLANLAKGTDLPSERAVELATKVFDRPPYYFLETRLAAARDRIDPEKNGYEGAKAELGVLQQSHPYYPQCPPQRAPSAGKGGRCQFCGYEPAKHFVDDDADTLLETHQGHWWGQAVRLCPTCHAAEHLGLRRPHKPTDAPDLGHQHRALPEPERAAERAPPDTD